MPNDGGHLLLSDEERRALIDVEPSAAQFIRKIVGPDEFIYDLPRWCLWLRDAKPSELRSMPEVLQRIASVKAKRLQSSREETKELANTPALFGEIRQPSVKYLAVPKTSSERRHYIPMGFLPPEVITTTDIFMLAGAGAFEFGVLTSQMHMAWTRQICGRLKSDYRYSSSLVYNSFPWPVEPTAKQKAAVVTAAESVLEAREQFPGQTFADLYDPLAMPKALREAHRDLDRAVDRCYRSQPFTSERQRVEYLFDLYQRLAAPLTAPTKGRTKRHRATKPI
jgi:hypothetical protein